MMNKPSIKQEVIGLLTNQRQITSAERAEIDTLGVALSLGDNDPLWGQVVWCWAVTPRKEWLELSHQALASEIRHDLKSLISDIGNSIGGAPAIETAKLDELKSLIESVATSMALRPPAVQTFDQNAIKAAIAAALDGKKGVISTSEMLDVIKDAAREIVSWSAAVVAAIVLGVSLFVGYSVGQHVQSSSDDAALQSAQKQIADLTAALPKSTSKGKGEKL